MAVKTFKPTTPTRRFASVVDYAAALTAAKDKPKTPRKLTKSISKTGGRNVYGRTTSYHKGGGHKRRYRVIDFDRNKLEIPGKVASIEYDPFRTAFIALINYVDGDKRYILAPLNLKVGDQVLASDSADIQPGNSLKLKAMPVGSLIHNIELEPGRGGKVARSAGQYAQLLAKEGQYCHVKMPSGETRLLHAECRATVGQLSNTDNENVKLGKAGRTRWLGIRPTVRGVVMNPVDHPMGGGEGRASGGHPRSPWGQKAKGLKTRTNKRTNRFIQRRRKKR